MTLEICLMRIKPRRKYCSPWRYNLKKEKATGIDEWMGAVGFRVMGLILFPKTHWCYHAPTQWLQGKLVPTSVWDFSERNDVVVVAR